MRPLNGTVLGLDWGARKIGWATADSKGISISPQGHLKRHASARHFQLHPSDTESLQTIIRSHEIDHLVLGLPQDSDGNDSASSQALRKLAETLIKNLGLDVSFVNERWTTQESTQKFKQYQDDDAASAALILDIFFKERALNQKNKGSVL